MQALLLAAGQGKRLAQYTKDNTKCMVEVNGKKLIDRAIENLKKNDINKLIVVVGYKKENLEKYLQENFRDIEIVIIENENYANSKNIYSMYLAKDEVIKDDTILLESDLIYDSELIEKLLNNPNPNVAAVAKYEEWMDGTVVELNKENDITAFIEKKDINWDKVDEYYKTINIYKLSSEFSKKEYIPFLETFMNAYGNNEYYELAFKIIANLGRSNLKAEVINNIKWYEIDNENDLKNAKEMFK